MANIWIAYQTKDDKTGRRVALATTVDTRTDLSLFLHRSNIVRFCIPIYEKAARDLVKAWNDQIKMEEST